MARRHGEVDALDDEDALVSLEELEEEEYEEPSTEDLLPSILDPLPDEDEEDEDEDD